MTDKGMYILQDCTHSEKDPSLCIETHPAFSRDGIHTINIKVEEISDVELEEDPLPISFPGIEAEHAVSCAVRRV
jgi:hypothetical protein